MRIYNETDHSVSLYIAEAHKQWRRVAQASFRSSFCFAALLVMRFSALTSIGRNKVYEKCKQIAVVSTPYS